MQARAKTFDAVAMKLEIQERLARETAGMTPAQRREHYEQLAAAFRQSRDDRHHRAATPRTP